MKMSAKRPWKTQKYSLISNKDVLRKPFSTNFNKPSVVKL